MEIKNIGPGSFKHLDKVPVKTEEMPAKDSVALSQGRIAHYKSVTPGTVKEILDSGNREAQRVFFTSDIEDVRHPPGDKNVFYPPPTPLCALDGTIYVGTNKGTLMAFENDGDKKWEFDIGRASAYNDPHIGVDGTIYLGGRHSTTVIALHPDGTEKFRTELPEDPRMGPEADDNGNVYLSTREHLYKLTPDGEVEKSIEIARKTGFLIKPDGNILTATYNKGLLCVDQNLDTLWEFTSQEGITSMPGFGPRGTTMITDGTTLKILDDQGEARGAFDAEQEITSNILVDNKGTSYIGGTSMFAVDDEGKKTWEFKAGGEIHGMPALGQDNTIYFTSRDAHLYAVKDGALQWKSFIGEEYTREARVAPDGTIYVDDGGRKLYIFDKDGSKHGEFESPQKNIRLSDSFHKDGHLMACDFEKLYALKERSALDIARDLQDKEAANQENDASQIDFEGDWVIIGGVRLRRNHRAHL